MLSVTNRAYFKDLLEAQYLSKFLKRMKLLTPPITVRLPPGAGPDPVPFLDVRDALLGDLLITALSQPEPEVNRPLFINQIKESGIHIEVIKELIEQFEDGSKQLKEELNVFERKKY